MKYLFLQIVFSYNEKESYNKDVYRATRQAGAVIGVK